MYMIYIWYIYIWYIWYKYIHIYNICLSIPSVQDYQPWLHQRQPGRWVPSSRFRMASRGMCNLRGRTEGDCSGTNRVIIGLYGIYPLFSIAMENSLLMIHRWWFTELKHMLFQFPTSNKQMVFFIFPDLPDISNPQGLCERYWVPFMCHGQITWFIKTPGTGHQSSRDVD